MGRLRQSRKGLNSVFHRRTRRCSGQEVRPIELGGFHSPPAAELYIRRQRHRESVMRKKIGFLLLGLLIIACWYFWSAYRHPTPEAIVHGVRAGMSEGQVRSALKAMALDSGTVYWGGAASVVVG